MRGVKRNQIAWQIAYDLMVHSIQPLTIMITHPCTEQYSCLHLRRADVDNRAASISINLNGESLLLSAGLLNPYQKLYAKNRIN
jgi:hypothetical protein